MNSVIRTYFALLTLCLSGGILYADTLTLKDGDKLFGTLLDIREGTVSIRTHLAGKVLVPVHQIKGVSTTHFVVVALEDERLIPGRLTHRNGKVFVVNQRSGEEHLIDLAKVTGVSSIVSTVVGEAKGKGALPDGSRTGISANTGYRWRAGTVDYSGPFLKIEARHETDKAALSADVDTEYVSETGEFDRFFDVVLKGRLRRGPGWNPEIAVEVERNRDKALEFRGDLRIGVARRFFEGEHHSLEAGAGVGIAVERYDVDPLRRDQQDPLRNFRFEGPKNKEELNLNLSFRYTRLIFNELIFEEDLALRPSLSDPGDLRGYIDSALTWPITPKLRLQVNVLVDFEDGTVYRGLEEWRTTVGASIGVKF